MCNNLYLFRETNGITERQGRGGGNSLTNDGIEILRQLFYRYSNETSMQLSNLFFLVLVILKALDQSKTIEGFKDFF